MKNPKTYTRILRLPTVSDRTLRSRSAIYAAIRAGTFPAPIKLGPRSIGFLEDEIESWIAEKIAASRDSKKKVV